MPIMTMNKAIHGAFRRDLVRFTSALENFPVGNRTRAGELHAAWVNFDDQLRHHHEGEHSIAWPTLTSLGISAELLQTMDDEHDAMANALAVADGAMSQLRASPGKSEAASALDALRALQSVTVSHLDHEESEFEDFMVANHDTPEFKAMGKAFGKVSPSRGGRFFAWVLDGATPEERRAVTSEVPGPIRVVVGGVFGRGYRKDIAPTWTR